MLNIYTIWISASVYLLPKCGIGMEGVGWMSVYVRSTSMCVTASDGDSLGRVVRFGNSSAMPENNSDVILGIYDVRHLYWFIAGQTYHPFCIYGTTLIYCGACCVWLFSCTGAP